MKLRYRSLAFMLAASILITQPVYAEVKDNVGGMNTGPIDNTSAAGVDQILAGYSAWVNGESVIGTMSNLTGNVGYKTITENTIDSKPNAKIILNSTGKITAGTTYVDVPIEYLKNEVTTLNKAYIFYSSPVDMKQYTSDWAKLRTSDFIAGVTSASSNGYWGGRNGTTSGTSCSASAKASITYNYNASTGQLTFSSSNASGQSSHYSELSTSVYVSGVFCVWKGTFSG